MPQQRQQPDGSRDPGRRQNPPQPPWRGWIGIAFYVAFAFAMIWIWQSAFEQMTYKEIPYSQFKKELAAGHVKTADVGSNWIRGRIVPAKAQATGKAAEGGKAAPSGAPGQAEQPKGQKPVPEQGKKPAAKQGKQAPPGYLYKTVRVEDPGLVKELQAKGVQFKGVQPSTLERIFWTWILPIGVVLLIWLFLFRRVSNVGQSALSFGRSQARLVAEKQTGVGFEDVAGCEEAKQDLQEVVDFLRHPERYEDLGARIPKGVLLIGPPGTGKTLLARAVAGEAGVPFFSLSGSEFVEMFVGVGAARVRDLFQQAKKQAPCIVFVDELDAIGRQRGVSMGQVHEEREQTLNQLLVEMDGFEANAGVILLSATNRPEILDRALLRPGRFDRQVVLDAPSLEGRVAILKVHSKGKPLEGDVDLRQIARSTPGMSGADLANVMNEAALIAARAGAKTIQQKHVQEAVERIVAGPEQRSRRMSEEEKRRVAVHETGHALVAAYSAHADPVHKITIVPRGRAALGYTLQLPTGEHHLLARSALVDRVKGMLGGRAAEELVLGEVSTGAQNDLEHATSLVRQMVAMYGMGRSVRLAHCARPSGGQYLSDGAWSLERDCSEATAREIDEEVIGMLDEAYAQARDILEKHREELEKVSETLIERETLEGAEFYRLIGVARPVPEPSPPPPAG